MPHLPSEATVAHLLEEQHDEPIRPPCSPVAWQQRKFRLGSYFDDWRFEILLIRTAKLNLLGCVVSGKSKVGVVEGWLQGVFKSLA